MESRFRVQLCGGPAAGIVVAVAAFDDRISVYQNGGAPFAVAESTIVRESDVECLGSYELVQPLGPDRPVYVAAQDSTASPQR